jgi:hypothetical protein
VTLHRENKRPFAMREETILVRCVRHILCDFRVVPVYEYACVGAFLWQQISRLEQLRGIFILSG